LSTNELQLWTMWNCPSCSEENISRTQNCVQCGELKSSTAAIPDAGRHDNKKAAASSCATTRTTPNLQQWLARRKRKRSENDEQYSSTTDDSSTIATPANGPIEDISQTKKKQQRGSTVSAKVLYAATNDEKKSFDEKEGSDRSPYDDSLVESNRDFLTSQLLSQQLEQHHLSAPSCSQERPPPRPAELHTTGQEQQCSYHGITTENSHHSPHQSVAEKQCVPSPEESAILAVHQQPQHSSLPTTLTNMSDPSLPQSSSPDFDTAVSYEDSSPSITACQQETTPPPNSSAALTNNAPLVDVSAPANELVRYDRPADQSLERTTTPTRSTRIGAGIMGNFFYTQEMLSSEPKSATPKEKLPPYSPPEFSPADHELLLRDDRRADPSLQLLSPTRTSRVVMGSFFYTQATQLSPATPEETFHFDDRQRHCAQLQRPFPPPQQRHFEPPSCSSSHPGKRPVGSSNNHHWGDDDTTAKKRVASLPPSEERKYVANHQAVSRKAVSFASDNDHDDDDDANGSKMYTSLNIECMKKQPSMPVEKDADQQDTDICDVTSPLKMPGINWTVSSKESVGRDISNDASDFLPETSPEDSAPSTWNNVGFCTAGSRTAVTVSKEQLQLASTLMQDDRSMIIKPTAPPRLGLWTAGQQSTITDNLNKASALVQDGSLVTGSAAVGFGTAGNGCAIEVSNKEQWQRASLSLLPDQPSQALGTTCSTSLVGFCTAGKGSEIEISKDNLRRAATLMQDNKTAPALPRDPLSLGFCTAGKRTTISISKEELQKASALMQSTLSSGQTDTTSRDFGTAEKHSALAVSNEHLELASMLLQAKSLRAAETGRTTIGFCTAGRGNAIAVSKEHLQRASSLILDHSTEALPTKNRPSHGFAVSREELDRASALIDDKSTQGCDSSPNGSAFCTAGKDSAIIVSDEHSQRASTLLNEPPTEFLNSFPTRVGFCAAGNGSAIEVSTEDLQQAATLIQDRPTRASVSDAKDVDLCTAGTSNVIALSDDRLNAASNAFQERPSDTFAVGRASFGFCSAGKGSAISVSKEALKRASSLVSSEVGAMTFDPNSISAVYRREGSAVDVSNRLQAPHPIQRESEFRCLDPGTLDCSMEDVSASLCGITNGNVRETIGFCEAKSYQQSKKMIAPPQVLLQSGIKATSDGPTLAAGEENINPSINLLETGTNAKMIEAAEAAIDEPILFALNEGNTTLSCYQNGEIGNEVTIERREAAYDGCKALLGYRHSPMGTSIRKTVPVVSTTIAQKDLTT
jgi:hypothetical protein